MNPRKICKQATFSLVKTENRWHPELKKKKKGIKTEIVIILLLKIGGYYEPCGKRLA